MKTLEYEVYLSKPPAVVWRTMLAPDTYNDWAKGFSPASQYRGEWKQGSEIVFFDPNMGGTKAIVDELTPHERIKVSHIAIVGKDGAEDRDSEGARKWIGTAEEYCFTATGAGTALTIRMEVDEAFEMMLASGWSKSLALLQELVDNAE